MTLTDVVLPNGDGRPTREELLRLAAALEDSSSHPVARAIVAGAGVELAVAESAPTVESVRDEPGSGLRGVVDGHDVIVGRPSHVARVADVGRDVETARRHAESSGHTAVVVAVDGVAQGVLVLADAIKDTSADAVAGLIGLGLTPVLLTGDNRDVAERVAAEVGIERVIAEVTPEGKVDAVAQLQQDGRVVAMIGDGVNDAAALAQADLGLAMGTGTDAAIAAADLTLVRGDLGTAVDAIRLSRRTLSTIRSNLFWAFAYNVAAIPLAAFGLLDPMLAGAAMALSSVFVVGNSLRLRSFV